MRRSILTLAIAALFVAQGPVSADDLLFSSFASYLDSLRVRAGIPGMAAAVVGGDGILWERGFGKANLERAIPATTITPFQVDGLTEIFTSTLILHCVEQGRLSLDDPIGQYDANAPDPGATIGQILTHTSGPADNLVFAYRPDRLVSLGAARAACSQSTYRATLADLLHSQSMLDSVPGADAVQVTPPADGITQADLDQYAATLKNLAIPYSVDKSGRATPTQYQATALDASTGLITTVDDYARFDLALRQGILLRPETLAAAWRAPAGKTGQPLPHGLGWFVQNYNGETVAWQFGLEENASSSLVLTVPERGLTLILLANSDGLEKAFAPAAGDVTVSPFAKVFLGLFVR